MWALAPYMVYYGKYCIYQQSSTASQPYLNYQSVNNNVEIVNLNIIKLLQVPAGNTSSWEL